MQISFLFKSAVLVRPDLCAPVYQVFHYISIYIFSPADATMFQNIQQSHSGESNTNLSWFQSAEEKELGSCNRFEELNK